MPCLVWTQKGHYMKMKTLGFLFAAAALTLGAAGHVNHAQARTVNGPAGSAINASDVGCFSHNAAAIWNSCSSTKKIGFPLVVDTPGSKNINVTMSGSGTCTAWGASNINTNVDFPDWKFNPTVLGNGYFQLRMEGITVPSGGYLAVECDLGPNSTILAINWNS